MSVEYLLAAFIVVLMPGTGVVYTVATGLTRGPAMSVAATFGCTLGILPSIAAAVLGLSALLHTSAVAFNALKYAGAAYLLYLAWKTWRESGPLNMSAGGGAKRSGAVRVAVTGFLINVLNPKLSVFFLAFLPQFVDPTASAPMPQMLTLSAVFMAMTFVVFLGYGLGAARIGAKILASARIMSWIRRTVAVAFAGFGLRLALSER